MIGLTEDLVVLAGQDFEDGVVLSSGVGRSLRVEEHADFSKDHSLIQFKVLVLDFAKSGVVDVDLNDSFAQEEDLSAWIASVDKHVLRLAELGGQLLNQVI